MSHLIAKYRENDSTLGEEVFLSIEGTDCGFVAMPDNGEDLDLFPADTVEEAREDLADYFLDWDTFEWLD
jgi:hypothetical protein